MHKFLFYNKSISCLYMFRALCAYHQKIKIALHSLWYHHTLQVAVRCTEEFACMQLLRCIIPQAVNTV